MFRTLESLCRGSSHSSVPVVRLSGVLGLTYHLILEPQRELQAHQSWGRDLAARGRVGKPVTWCLCQETGCWWVMSFASKDKSSPHWLGQTFIKCWIATVACLSLLKKEPRARGQAVSQIYPICQRQSWKGLNAGLSTGWEEVWNRETFLQVHLIGSQRLLKDS